MSETDRELLELAAKAFGIKADKSPYNGGGATNTGFDLRGNLVVDWHNGHKWNPLSDDGDALRLAVKLRIDIEWTEPEEVYASSHNGEQNRQLTEWAEHSGCPASATRRAIVRAAAEIGRTM